MENTLAALSDSLAAAVARAGRSVVGVNARQRSSSSGICLRPGVVATADHSIRREEEITLTLPGGESVPAVLAGRDPATDIAVLKADAPQLPAAETAPADTLRAGHLVLAVGRGPSASLGVVSALDGPWRTWRGGQIDRFIRPALALYPGFSGGPLVDTSGRVVGMNTSGLTRHFDVALPVSTVERVAGELLASGRVSRGYLGVGLHPVALSPNLKNRLHLDADGGLILLSVEPGGPAESGGLLVGDILLALDGTPVADTDDVQRVLGAREAVGKVLQVRVIRGGAMLELPVTAGERGR